MFQKRNLKHTDRRKSVKKIAGLHTVNYMGGQTTLIASLTSLLKNLWEHILQHQSVDIGLKKPYAI